MRINVDWRVSATLVGVVLKWLSVPLAFPLLVAVYYREALAPFLVAMAISVLAGEALVRVGHEARLGPREAFLMVAVTWFVVPLIGAVPFVLAGVGSVAHPINALFESMSGITTTGATVLVDFEIHARSIMMWRQVSQWLGGLGILVLATAILSQIGVGGAQLMESETQTRDVNKLDPRIARTARLLGGLYIGMTLLLVAILYSLSLAGLAPNMGLYNAIAHPLTTVSTAGFSPEPDSIMAFSPAVQWVITLFMIIGATNFVLIYFALQGDWRRLVDSEEFRFYIALLALLAAITAVLLAFESDYAGGVERTVRHAVFNTVSMLTTTGYANVDFDRWEAGAKHVMFVCMFIGGMAGSTTCSIKTLRWLVVLKGFRRDLFTSIHPEAIRPVRLSDEVIDEETVRDIYAFALVNLLLFSAATILVVVDGARVGLPLNEFEAMGAAAATFLNIGPAFGIAGPFGTYEAFPATTKLAMILLMWIGRIEVIPVLVLLTKAFWTS
ncbi:TrkH family potassium uptake protein [Halalkalicoccus jeotgali]|uniref:Trk-type transport system (Substrate potassium) 1, subunit 2.1 n=1 Tax=Halalkalicoccus jeotgali (strain DSM 18796 / CECT 7217 / JCM 14584 / KCTC 4019 / B3) TaxID=795797 RepID=D8J647_HALJB|nr:TrkH family potassium uptake protein [Halalkalicoccus jeotgali]ADJ15765.1 Trk-type transport system (substrate potassium) 1, subunit 2.1 [Halalkalicoccus jeotgali B3]ELY37211.1 Trk-type transport system (substrate potassium) 1, subunit 2.1 [Halalkalicoccus jeotgali B3]